MTAQAPDNLKNRHPGVSTRQWLMPLGLFGVLRLPVINHHGIPYEFDHLPELNRSKVVSTNLHRRYLATFCLQRDGKLVLQTYSYPMDGCRYDVQKVDETLAGDFWIVLQRHFHQNWCRLIPFRDGQVVTDRRKWEERTWDWSDMNSNEIEKAFQTAYDQNPHLAPDANAR